MKQQVRRGVMFMVAWWVGLPGVVASPAEPTVRPPAVAGLFYPRQPSALAAAVDGYLAAAPAPATTGELKALICPHAGYPFSGPVAASAFRLLKGRSFDTVVVLGPAHYALLNAASVSGADAYRTPLGDVPISSKARQLGGLAPYAIDPPCDVERPDWAAPSSRAMAPHRADRADTWEHADEVEVPFLQRTLSHFDLVPVVVGDVDPARAANALGKVLDDRTLLVVSSDLSHYHPYAEARQLDRACVDAILALDVRKMAAQEACGRIPILTLLHLARERGWQPQLLDFRNSGDTAGDKSRVVGYTAIAFFAPAATTTTPAVPGELTAGDQRYLLSLARSALRDSAAGRPLPTISRAALNPELTQPAAVFVTLTQRGNLRGCIGHLIARMPLYQAVLENARSAALHDPRFSPVRPDEVTQLEIEVSVLSAPQPLAFTSPDDLLRRLTPKQDGVILTVGAGTATYLPQVWEMLPDKREFLDTLAEKAGGQAGDWRKPGASVSVYHVFSFKE